MTRIRYLALGIGVSLLLTPVGLCVDETEFKPDIWTLGGPFSKPLDIGVHGGPKSDPRNPPTLELVLLSWNFGQLIATGDFHNPRTKPLRVRGYFIADFNGDHVFYPSVRLQLSDTPNGEWRDFSISPSRGRGDAKLVTVPPDFFRIKASDRLDPTRHFAVELDPYRRLVGKNKFWRVVLPSGETSQVRALSDLLPEKDSGFWSRGNDSD